jgi:hypothetical protein
VGGALVGSGAVGEATTVEVGRPCVGLSGVGDRVQANSAANARASGITVRGVDIALILLVASLTV